MFKLKSDFAPAGDQPKAIKQLVEGLDKAYPMQTLLGVTGSGKTFTMANVIQAYQKPTIVIAHNKILAFQLYNELREFFPENKVGYFISYYDYYQPESYVPATDTYIEKDAQINPRIEQMRLAATTNLMTRSDVIIVASVSCIYGLGNPKTYENLAFQVSKGQEISRRGILLKLLAMLYERNETELVPGRFRVKGSTIDLVPSYQDNVIRISMEGEKISRIQELKKLDFTHVCDYESFFIFPARHFVVDKDSTMLAIEKIKAEFEEYYPELEAKNPLFAYRLKQRVNYDMEMIEQVGYCSGIENYSRFFDGRSVGDRPYCLLDYFPKDFLMIIDESHQTIPQINGMYKGDRSRKETLIDYGFRLPSALDNRPLKFDEFKQFMRHVMFVSATPAEYEREHSSQIAEQIIRPTWLVDPEVFIRPTTGQMDDLIHNIRATIEKNNRILVTTITKRLSEELTDYLANAGLKVRYFHSEIDALERTEIIRQLRLGVFDVLVGINLLREGLDIPEVGFVAILDADKEGFLRNDKSLIQTIGRAARNVDSTVILYADTLTDSIRRTLDETNRRRTLQIAYNAEHGVTPATIIKPIPGSIITLKDDKSLPKKEIPNLIIELEAEMKKAAENLDFERAIEMRNRVRELQAKISGSKKKTGSI